jgi:hypothetical protein
VLAVLLLPAFVLAASSSGAPKAGLGRFLLVYTTCDGGACSGGATQRLVQSNDGVRWTPVASFAPWPGASPSAVRRGKRLYVLDSVQVAPEGILGSIRRFAVTTTGLSELSPVQVVLDTPSDLTEITAVSGSLTRDAAGALVVVLALRFEPNGTTCKQTLKACLRLRTVTEVAGTDGDSYTTDSRDRAAFTFDTADAVIDPTVFAGDKGIVLFLSGPGSCLRTLVATDVHAQYRGGPGLPGGCLAVDPALATPSGAYRKLLAENWVYGVDDGKVLRAVTRKLGSRVGPGRFRPLRGLGDAPVQAARLVLNTP